MRVVGIGASAGGLEAFHNFFAAMPPDCGMAFVVILHLPLGRKSMLPDILARWTPMRVLEGHDGMQVEPNCIYVPPPHAAITLEGERLRIRLPSEDSPRDFRPIDSFFDSLAAALREQAVGIVLSGTGSDGALGLKAIKQNGGLTIAQGTDGTGPLYDGMPAGAIAIGAVDLVAAADAIPGHLLRLRHPDTPEQEAEPESPEQIDAIRLAICDILRAQVGHDFSGYRDKTFMRRVRRRMQVTNQLTLAHYVARLQADHGEVVQLFRDLLIRVTSFFRDAEAFDTLERLVMPRLFDGKHADGTVRVWVPGCATGEEAYSLAILLREQLDRRHAKPKVQLFATDIDEAAIATARLGHYPATLLDGLSEARRERFFQASPSGYSAVKEIRDLCTFSPHSVVRDPPFSRMDLISCRNLLIYMDTELQASVLPAFHYGLLPGGVLLLGSSESTSRHEALFEPLDKKARIFIKRAVPTPMLLLRDHPGRLRERSHYALPPRPPPAWPADARTSRHDRTLARPPPTGAARTPTSSEQAPQGWRQSRLARAVRAAFTPARVRHEQALQRQLLLTQEELQSVVEEHETALEELRSANEELHSVNEELQSTNEELETSKEELQSVNEELHTLNARLSEKVDELDIANSDLRNLFDSTQVATIFLDRNLLVRNFTPAAASIYSLIPSDHGRPLTDIVCRLRYDSLRQDVAQVLATLEPVERRITRTDGQAHYLLRILPYRAPDDAVSGTLVTFLEVTTIVAAEQHHRLLVDELNHRVKNMLTVVVSLASQTLRRSSSLEGFSDAFMGRLRALSASYSLLSGHSWTDVALRDVLIEETKPFAAQERNNILMDGPDVRLAPAGALALGLAIHELVTNAVKYGALSVMEGRVRLDWRIEGGHGAQQLVLDWAETGGPAVTPPERRGFGITLIERGFAHELSGEAVVTFAPGGVKATFRAPLSALAPPGSVA